MKVIMPVWVTRFERVVRIFALYNQAYGYLFCQRLQRRAVRTVWNKASVGNDRSDAGMRGDIPAAVAFQPTRPTSFPLRDIGVDRGSGILLACLDAGDR